MTNQYDKAKQAYDIAMVKLSEEKAEAKLAAYNNWRAEQERKGKAQDDHSRGLVKKMGEMVIRNQPGPVTESMCNVLGNMDCKFIYTYI